MERRKERGGEGISREERRGKEEEVSRKVRRKEKEAQLVSLRNHSLRKCLHKAILTLTHQPSPPSFPPTLTLHTHIFTRALTLAVVGVFGGEIGTLPLAITCPLTVVGDRLQAGRDSRLNILLGAN